MEKDIPPSLSNRYFVTEAYIPQITSVFPPGKRKMTSERLYTSLGLQKILLYLKNILLRQSTSLTDFLSSTPVSDFFEFQTYLKKCWRHEWTAPKSIVVSSYSFLSRGATQEISQRSILSGKYIFEVKKYFLQSQRSI